MKTMQNKWVMPLILIVLIVLTRIIAQEIYWFNFVPLVAISLFSGAIIGRNPLGYMVPLVGLLGSDLFFHFFTSYPGFYGPEQGLVYLSFFLVSLLGSRVPSVKPAPVLGFTLLGALVFFLVSNFGTYLTGIWGSGWEGLGRSYWMAIPFFRNSLIADLLGSSLLFGVYIIGQRIQIARAKKAKSI